MATPKGYIVTSLSIPISQSDVFEKFKMLAKSRGESVSSLVRSMMADYVATHPIQAEDSTEVSENAPSQMEDIHPLAAVYDSAAIPPPEFEPLAPTASEDRVEAPRSVAIQHQQSSNLWEG